MIRPTPYILSLQTELEVKPSLQAQPVGTGGDDAMEDELYGDLAPPGMRRVYDVCYVINQCI